MYKLKVINIDVFKIVGFVVNESKRTKTVLIPTDRHLDYFHLININDGGIIPLTGPIGRIELSDCYDFEKGFKVNSCMYYNQLKRYFA